MKSRRSFLKTVGNFVALTAMPMSSVVAATSRIIVVGGGVAGTRAAAYLKTTIPAARVLLFDPVLDSFNDRKYYAIQNKYKPVSGDVLREIGVEIIADKVMQIDPGSRLVYLASGKEYKADVLVVAPGVDFKWQSINGYLPGMEHNIMHAWQHPSNELALWKQVEAMGDGGTVVISIPQAPYRFPQGPYQRATRIADYLKNFKPASKILLLDSNNAFSSMHSYLAQWEQKFPAGMVEWVAASSGGIVEQVDVKNNRLIAAGEQIQADVLNLIPAQQAGSIARYAGLNYKNDWCQVASRSLESVHYKDVYVLGDANDADLYNKTAATAECQAVQCVTAIRERTG